jgi:hypothetical protein
MRIGFIGAGNIGGTLAERFAAAGHEVAVSNSREPETLSDLVASIGERARAVTREEAAEFGEVVVVTIPLKAYRDVPAGPLAGKVVIDTNNYYPGRDGNFEALDRDETTSSEMLAEHLAEARVVKAFNAILARNIRDLARADGEGRIAIPIAGDDEAAKTTVAALVDEIGFDAVDMGALAAGRAFQPDTPPYGVPLTADELRQYATA